MKIFSIIEAEALAPTRFSKFTDDEPLNPVMDLAKTLHRIRMRFDHMSAITK